MTCVFDRVVILNRSVIQNRKRESM